MKRAHFLIPAQKFCFSKFFFFSLLLFLSHHQLFCFLLSSSTDHLPVHCHDQQWKSRQRFSSSHVSLANCVAPVRPCTPSPRLLTCLTVFFPAPFTNSSTQVLTLKNTTDSRQAFKVKTTAPKLYFVRPNTSIVDPGETAEVSVIIQPFKEDPPSDYQCNDKFLVMSTPLAHDNPITANSPEFATFWTNDAPDFKEHVTNKKVRVRYVFGESTEGAANPSQTEAVSSAALGGEKSPASVPSSEPHSVLAPVAAVPVKSRSAAPATKPQQPPSYTQLDQDASLQEALDKAQARIRALSSELEEQKSITSVKANSSSSKSNAVARPTAGVPLPQAALLVLVAFLVGWFFF